MFPCWQVSSFLEFLNVDIPFGFFICRLSLINLYIHLLCELRLQHVPKMHIVTSSHCVALFLAILTCTVSYASPTSETSLPAAETVAANVPLVLADPWPAHPGIAPYFGRQTLRLQKRQCLENGSNFCFDDSNRMCPDCGGCCELDGGSWCCPDEGDTCCPGEACCKADETCCGDGCCPKGRRCSGGKCEAPE